jgi:hypothetical protein
MFVLPDADAGSYVVRSGTTWMPVAFISTLANATAYCTTTTLNALTGWRVPSAFELRDLYASGAMTGQGWALSKTWSPTTGLCPARVIPVQLP